MTDIKNKANLKLTDDEAEIIDIFRNIPEQIKNEALIKLYILAENSETADKNIST